jgi:hypothetical protein
MGTTSGFSTQLKIGMDFFTARRANHKHSTDVLRDTQLLATFWATFFDVIAHGQVGKRGIWSLNENKNKI